MLIVIQTLTIHHRQLCLYRRKTAQVPVVLQYFFAGLYWTGKSQDADSFTATKRVQNGTQTVNTTSIINHNQTITDTNYRLDIDRVADGGNKFSPTYTFTGNGNTYVFNYTTDASATVTLSVNGVKQDDIPVSITISGTTTTATLTKLTASQMDQLH
jgi:hypothetical protein